MKKQILPMIILIIIVIILMIFILLKNTSSNNEVSDLNIVEENTIATNEENLVSVNVTNVNTNETEENEETVESEENENIVIEEEENTNEVLESDGVNSTYSKYEGTQTGTSVRSLLVLVVSNNSTDTNHQIIVESDGEKYSDVAEINEFRSSLTVNKNYNVSFEYENDYITKVVIK